jgi:preprotein translocase subunit SecA
MTEAEQAAAIVSSQPQNRGTSAKKVGRNQPCPCGSGKKYKNCHGAPTGPRA